MTPTLWKWAICVLVLILIAIGLFFWLSPKNTEPSALDEFAQCLKDKGVIFYGAFWCPHCQEQKEMFGSSVKFLPYVECSTPDGQGQTPICTQKNITGYPTWVFPDGTQESGALSLQELSQKSGCALP